MIGRPRVCFHPLGKHGYCRICNPLGDAKRRQRNKDYIAEYKNTHPCIKCGEPDPVVLEFHHVKGKKRWDVTKAVGKPYSLPTVRKEIEKCEVLCANCHRRETVRIRNERNKAIHKDRSI